MIGANSLTLKLVILRPGTRQALAFYPSPSSPIFKDSPPLPGRLNSQPPASKQPGCHTVWLIPYVLSSLVIVFLIEQIIKVDSLDLVGSGVPQIKAILLDKHHLCW